MQDLAGKVAVVTGGAGGLGRAMAEAFLSDGMAVALADIEEGALDATARELSAAGEVLAVVTDVTDPGSVEDLERAVHERFGGYHVVCNNAGVGGHFGLTWETPVEEWRWVFDVNIWGVIHGIRAFVPALVAQGSGHVVNTASLAGWIGGAAMGPYSASKHAVLAISESLRSELAAVGADVGVSVLCPGMVNSGIMTSERNWPSHLGPEPAHGQQRPPVVETMRRLLLEGTTGGGLDPVEVAAVVLEGIRTNRFVLTTHTADLHAAARARLAHAQAADPASTPPG